MKFFKIALLLFSTTIVSAQNQWKQLMFDKTSNFNEIVSDFNKYYQERGIQDAKNLPKGLGIKQFKRWEYYWSQRVDVNGNFPEDGSVLKEYQKYLDQNSTNRYATGTGNWKIVGPVYSPSNNTGQMTGNGRVASIAFHPTQPNTLFVGAPAGGLWKSTDNGYTWTEYSIGLTRLGVSSIVVHPTNPDIIYVGTGDRDAGDSPGYGVWRSTDGGQTWSPRNTGMGNRTINEIIMSPVDPNILLAAGSNNIVYRSTDGGANWLASAGLTVNPKDIAFHPTNSSIVYASGTKFFKSTNGGANWAEVTSGVPAGTDRIALAVSPNQPNWVYLLAGGGSGLVGIYKSIDSGANFATQTTGPNILGYATNGSDTASQAWYDLAIAADPTNANIIYTGGVNLWKSLDGGVTMSCVSYWVSSSGGIDGVHADQHVLEFSPHTNAVYNGNDGGLYYTTDGGVKWNEISSGLGIAQIYKIGVSQQKFDLVINGYQDNGSAMGRGSNFVTVRGGDGMECAIDPTNDNYIYAEAYNGSISRSTNGGASFSGIAGSITEGGPWVTPYKLDPNNSNTMLAGFVNIWRNTDVRATNVWTQISAFAGTSTVVDLAIAPSNSNVVYVSRNGTNRFYKSSDALAASPTWTDLTASLPVTSTPKDIEIDPTNPNIVYVAIGNKIYKTTNGGTSWADFSGTLPAISLNTIAIDKSSPISAMYVGMDVGVYYRDSTMSNWISYSTGLSNLEITELEIHYNTTECNSKLYAATYGQGLWVSDLKDPGSVAPIACFDIKNTSGCTDAVFPLTDNSNNTPTSWLWSITPATFSFANSTTATSQNPQVLFNASGSYTIQLTATNAFGSSVVSKIANIQISAGTIASSFNQNFETQTACSTASNCGADVCAISGLWSNLTNGTKDDIDWRIDVGGTPTVNTGPDVDYNPGTATGKYAYLEASSCRANTAILESQCIFLDQDYNFEFAYHMYGESMGSLHVDLFSNGVWKEDYITPFYGDKGNQWYKASIDLNAFVGQTIKIRIRGITGFASDSDLAIDDILIVSKCSEATVWNGSAWSNGIPNTDKIAVINGNYSTAVSGNIECCKIVVNNGFELNINDSNYVLVENEVTVNGTLKVKNNGSLVQENNAAINTGNITYERIASIRQQDYVYWSSPVSGFVTNNISTLTPSQYIFKWDPTYVNPNGGSGYWLNASGQLMSSGKGYIVRGPSTFNNSSVQNFTAIFNNGVPNNGVISVPISRGNRTANFVGNNGVNITKFDDNLNLIGNPYPSAIDALSFLNLNSGAIEGTVRIWTHNTLPSGGTSNPFYGSYVSNYSTNDFIVYNGTGTLSGPTGFNGFIAGGQGFFVTMHDGPAATGNVVFKNELRSKANNNSQFYRTESGIQKNRIWLDLVNSSQSADRTLIGYVEGATNQKDWLFDTYTKVEANTQRIYTFANDDPLAIQAFGLPFSDTHVVPLGVQLPAAGTYNISLFAVDGLFANQNVIVRDKLNNAEHNLKQSPYVFVAQQGTFNNRFELIYKSELLDSQDFNAANSFAVFGNESGIHLKAAEIITEITVYDVLGRILYAGKGESKNEAVISSIPPSNQTLLVKVKLENGTLLTRKLIF
ncbi:VPS10 domain-containing protein [Flavobacterium pedocola]